MDSLPPTSDDLMRCPLLKVEIFKGEFKFKCRKMLEIKSLCLTINHFMTPVASTASSAERMNIQGCIVFPILNKQNKSKIHLIIASTERIALDRRKEN